MDWLHVREPVSAWTHGFWMLLSIPGTYVLWRLSRGDALKERGMLVFGGSMMFCFGSSWLYHSVHGPLIEPAAALDHVGIFILIAGTCTPIGLVVLRGRWRVGLLGVMWLSALVGIAVRLTVGELPRALGTGYYLAMGWVGAVTCAELARLLGPSRLFLLWLGGLFYSVGAVVHVTGRPALVPGAFGAHELFHLFVMAGSLCHYYFMLVVVVPHVRPVVREAAGPAAVRPALTFGQALARNPAEG